MILGLDTSNYKTSVACFEPESGFLAFRRPVSPCGTG